MDDYTRITTVLAPFSGMGAIPPGILAAAADRGTRVHQAVENELNGLGLAGCDDDIQGYLESFKQIESRIGKIYVQEERFNNDNHKLTGQIDLIADFAGHGKCLIDWKTSAKFGTTWESQLSAYRWLVSPKIQVDGCLVVQLQKDGRAPHIRLCEDKLELFFKCLEIYRIFFQNQKEDERWEMI